MKLSFYFEIVAIEYLFVLSLFCNAVFCNRFHLDGICNISTCSAVIVYADWSIGVTPGAGHTL